MRIREARVEDVAELAGVHVASWRAAYRDLLPKELLANLSVGRRAEWWLEVISKSRDKRVVVAEEGGRVLGFSSFGTSRDEDMQGYTAEIYAIYLLEEAWGRGFGKALLDESLAQLQARGYEDVTLWVLHDNAQAIRFYERQGFGVEDAIKLEDRGEGLIIREVRYRYRFGEG